jgi:hypothetical protein
MKRPNPPREHPIRWRLWRVQHNVVTRARRTRWSWQNWRRGLKFDQIGRYRCCDHTTPYHYSWCENRPS